MHDQTRRNWLVTISHAAAGVGLAGTALTSAADAVAGLPPGIYEGSAAHLGHALMNSQRYHPIPPGCPTDYVRPRTAPFQPLFFNTSEFVTVRRLTRLLLGEMSDDSASSQQTAEWIDFVFSALRKQPSQPDGFTRFAKRLPSHVWVRLARDLPQTKIQLKLVAMVSYGFRVRHRRNIPTISWRSKSTSRLRCCIRLAIDGLKDELRPQTLDFSVS